MITCFIGFGFLESKKSIVFLPFGFAQSPLRLLPMTFKQPSTNFFSTNFDESGLSKAKSSTKKDLCRRFREPSTNFCTAMRGGLAATAGKIPTRTHLSWVYYPLGRMQAAEVVARRALRRPICCCEARYATVRELYLVPRRSCAMSEAYFHPRHLSEALCGFADRSYPSYTTSPSCDADAASAYDANS